MVYLTNFKDDFLYIRETNSIVTGLKSLKLDSFPKVVLIKSKISKITNKFTLARYVKKDEEIVCAVYRNETNRQFSGKLIIINKSTNNGEK